KTMMKESEGTVSADAQPAAPRQSNDQYAAKSNAKSNVNEAPTPQVVQAPATAPAQEMAQQRLKQSTFDSSSQGKVAQPDLEQSRPTATEGQPIARQQMQQQ